MKFAHQIVVFDAADLGTESSFWAGLLGGTVQEEDDWHMIYVDGEPRMGVQLAPAHDEAVALGARLLKAADDIEADDGFQVYADPAGHPFCLCRVLPGRAPECGRSIISRLTDSVRLLRREDPQFH